MTALQQLGGQASHLVVGAAADQGVGGGDDAAGAGAAVPPSDGAGIGRRAVVPQGAANQVVAVGELDQAAAAGLVVGAGSHQRIGRRDHADGAAFAVTPGDRPGVLAAAVVPVTTGYDVVAVAQRGHALAADVVTGSAADQGVGRRYRAADAGVLADQGHGAAAAVPDGTENDKMAVGQRHQTVAADRITAGAAGQGADQRAGGGIDMHRAGVGDRARGVVAGVGDREMPVGQQQHGVAESGAARRAGEGDLFGGGDPCPEQDQRKSGRGRARFHA